MNSKNVLSVLGDLCLSQLCLSKLTQISAGRISRFLNENLELRPEELERLGKVLCICRSMQERSERVATKCLINWDECVGEIKEKMKSEFTLNPDFDFCADLDFTGDNPALTFEIPQAVLKTLLSGGPDKILQITFGDVANLLCRIVTNAGNDATKRKEAAELLKVAIERPDATESERAFVLSLIQSQA